MKTATNSLLSVASNTMLVVSIARLNFAASRFALVVTPPPKKKKKKKKYGGGEGGREGIIKILQVGKCYNNTRLLIAMLLLG